MAIKMRTNKDEKAVCKCCGATRKHSLDMFDIAFTDKHIITICDLCNTRLCQKTLTAECKVQGKMKSQQDLKIIQARSQKGQTYWNMMEGKA